MVLTSGRVPQSPGELSCEKPRDGAPPLTHWVRTLRAGLTSPCFWPAVRRCPEAAGMGAIAGTAVGLGHRKTKWYTVSLGARNNGLWGKQCFGTRLLPACLLGTLSSAGFAVSPVRESTAPRNGPALDRLEQLCPWPGTCTLGSGKRAEPWEESQRNCQPLGGSIRGAKKDSGLCVVQAGPGGGVFAKYLGQLQYAFSWS